MLKYEQALKKILENTSVLPAQEVLIEDAVARILKEDIYSGIEMPPFDKSAMDGYALKSSDTQHVPAKLKCVGIIQAGEVYTGRLKSGECVKIMTGAPLPYGADSVVMVEDTRQTGAYVRAFKSVKKAENVCFKGEDLRHGQKVLNQGIEITPAQAAMLATVGRKYVLAAGKPRVAIVNTGGEIVPGGSKLGENKIYNSNGPMLQALLKSDGINPVFAGIAQDNFRDLRKAIIRGLQADVLLISGGVSMGDYDLVPGALRSAGVKEIFHKVNIKPGKPLFFGKKKNKIIFGIPGNPVSNFLTYIIFIQPALRKMMGHRLCQPQFKQGILQDEVRSKPGRRHFVLTKIISKNNRFYLSPVTSHGSADVTALSKADGFMIVAENTGTVKKNTKISFITWKTI